jgi:hypothetical protein
MGSLGIAKMVNILDEKPIEHGNVHIYGASWSQEIPKPIDPNAINILAVHDHISDRALFPNHRFKHPKAFLKEHRDYRVIICADIHRKFKIRLRRRRKGGHLLRWIVNCGPMVRLKATEYNFEHQPGFYVFNSTNLSLIWKKIPSEPAEEVLTTAHLESEKDVKVRMARITESIKGRMEKMRDELREEGISLERPQDKASRTFEQNMSLVIDQYDIEDEVRDILADLLGGK